jgi:hypothetical protein
VHDRLGSVKMVVDYNEVDATAFVVNSYGYTPFGQGYGTPDETVDNPFRFTGQYDPHCVVGNAGVSPASKNRMRPGRSRSHYSPYSLILR